MDGLIIFLLIVVIAMVGRLMWDIRRLHEQLRKHDIHTRVRQGEISRQKMNHATPTIDSRARTSVRDTDDLPATGRMSQGLSRRKNHDRHTDDDQLHVGP
jgi:hypothetical protein